MRSWMRELGGNTHSWCNPKKHGSCKNIKIQLGWKKIVKWSNTLQ